MTTTLDAPRAGAPWHFWVVAGLGLIWNAFGAYDYLMSMTAGDAYLRQAGMTGPQIAFYHAMPAWAFGVWAVGVWSAVLGSILLVVRSRWAVQAFLLSLAGIALSLIYSHLLSSGSQVMGMRGEVMNAVIAAGGLFLAWYAWRMAKSGVLR